MDMADAQPANRDVSATALHPPRPRCVLNIGITGHRADRLTPALEAAATRRAHEALALVQRLTAGPTGAYGRIKDLIGHSLDNALPAQLDREREAFLTGVRTADFKEGASAFLAKRPARFEGR